MKHLAAALIFFSGMCGLVFAGQTLTKIAAVFITALAFKAVLAHREKI